MLLINCIYNSGFCFTVCFHLVKSASDASFLSIAFIENDIALSFCTPLIMVLSDIPLSIDHPEGHLKANQYPKSELLRIELS